jgi:16S rRNA (guanine966-N2)-methyltransferase
MTRIVAGAARGRRLGAPPGQATRPTSDRAREGLFSTLTSLRGSLAGDRFLDLFAGSGAVGLEALSRGAASAVLVEADPRVARLVRSNARTVGLPGAEVVVARAEAYVAAGPPAEPCDVAFLDPPYAWPAAGLHALLRALLEGRWLAPGAVCVVERATRDGDFAWPAGYAPERSRRYGEGTLWYGRAADRPAS